MSIYGDQNITGLTANWLGGSLQINNNCAGSLWFVNSQAANASSNGPGTSWDVPFDSIDAAVNACTADRGDIILVAPCHTENCTGDSAIDIDVAGVTVAGIRMGRLMPTLTVTAADGDCKLAAARTSIHNLRFVGGVDAITGCIEVGAADCAVIDCEYRDATGQATEVLTTTTGGADRLTIRGWRHIGAAADGADSSIRIIDSDDVLIEDFWIYGNFDEGAISFETVASLRAHIRRGTIWTEASEDMAIDDNVTGCSGIIGPDLAIMLQDDAANITEAVTGSGFVVVDPVYVCNSAGEKAMLINWTASTDT